MKRSAIKRRSAYSRRQRYPGYLAWLHKQPCAIGGCGNWAIEAAHVGARGFGRKCSDMEAIPLCREHHRTGKEAHHVIGRHFAGHHGIDIPALIARYNALYLIATGQEQ